MNPARVFTIQISFGVSMVYNVMSIFYQNINERKYGNFLTRTG